MDRHPHDLDLPAWGPYSKRYAGCSHVPAPARGVRLDLSVFPGMHRGRLDIPQVAWDSGYAPWLAAPDGSYHAFKHQLEWHDRVTVETAYAALPGGGDGRVVRCRVANATDQVQSLDLHLVLGCQYPSPRPSGHVPPAMARPAELLLPDGGAWRDARDDLAHVPGHAQPRDGLCYDGWSWHELVEDGCIAGGCRWLDPGDAADYALAGAGDRLWLRVRAAPGTAAAIEVDGVRVPAPTTGTWEWVSLAHRGGTLRIANPGPGRIDLDALCLVPAGAPPQVVPRQWRPRPSIAAGPRPDSALIAWPDLPCSYGVWWGSAGRLRQWHAEALDDCMRRAVHDHVSAELRGPGEGHWCDVLVGPVVVPPGGHRDVFALIVAGDPAAVAARLADLDPAALPAIHDAARARAWDAAGNPSGAALGSSQRLMAATLCTNVVYPVYTRRGFVRHHCPGKAWDSLYTWDSGFLGLGLLELDPARCAGTLEQYLMPEGDRDCAFLHHGSPVPVQLHLARELWNRTRDRERFARIYPSLRQWHRFLAGRHGGSDTARLGSGLLSTFSYFYNSGGWDDYPPQQHIHANGLASRTAPMVNTSHAIATARLLKRLARILGRDDDAEYDADIARLGAAVQAHAWDPASGYFGYVLHDGDGRPADLLRHASGENFNRGLDGCSPLLAGICTPAQEAAIVGHLGDPARLWSPVGLSTVDRSAPYFRRDGYWNGAVWMPHQWFFWKRLLDLGHADLAHRIATTALEVWRTACATTERCWEHFPIDGGGQGAGWHHFGALSSPVLAWYAALHIPGRLTGGQDLWVLDQTFDGRRLHARIQLDGQAGRSSTVIACLPPGDAHATWNGRPLALRARHPGCWEADLPADGAGELVLTT